jgi:hypothetical protein
MRSDNIQAELVNLGNGLALSGDGLSASICQQAIVQINCLTADNRLLTAENRALVTKVQQAERDKARVVGLMDSYIVAGEPLADVMEREEYRIRLAHDQEQTIATLTAQLADMTECRNNATLLSERAIAEAATLAARFERLREALRAVGDCVCTVGL